MKKMGFSSQIHYQMHTYTRKHRTLFPIQLQIKKGNEKNHFYLSKILFFKNFDRYKKAFLNLAIKENAYLESTKFI